MVQHRNLGMVHGLLNGCLNTVPFPVQTEAHKESMTVEGNKLNFSVQNEGRQVLLL